MIITSTQLNKIIESWTLTTCEFQSPGLHLPGLRKICYYTQDDFQSTSDIIICCKCTVWLTPAIWTKSEKLWSLSTRWTSGSFFSNCFYSMCTPFSYWYCLLLFRWWCHSHYMKSIAKSNKAINMLIHSTEILFIHFVIFNIFMIPGRRYIYTYLVSICSHI